jgi:thiamine biosynthesis lipoprotein
VGVRNPLATSELIGTLTLTNGHAVATSGNYERFVTIGGRRYAHVLDPRTGKPVEGMAGVTVVARSAAEADAMSTALFVTGTNGAATILAGLPGCEALWVPDRRPLELVVTPGFRALFTPRRDIASRLSTLPPAPTPETRKAIKGLEAPPESL